MNKILGLDVGIFIAILTAITTITSSLITIIITKVFENYQNSKQHKRILIEKVIDTKLNVCRSAISYYGTYLNYLYTSKYTFQNLENYEYAKLLGESQKFREELLKKIQSENSNDHNQILLFFDLYGDEDESIADRLVKSTSDYVEFITNSYKQNFNSDKEKKIRNELIKSFEDAIQYFKNKIKIVREDLNSIM